MRLPFIAPAVYGAIGDAITSSCKVLFSAAHIESQPVFGEDNRVKHDKMFLVFGNPKQIEEVVQQAKGSGLTEIHLPTRSAQLFLFELAMVPLLFIVSLFIATPMSLRIKLANTAIALFILMAFIIFKVWVYTAYSISSHRIGIYEFSEVRMNALNRLIGFLSLGFSIVLGVILWLFLGFRQSSFVAEVQSFFTNKQNL